MSYPALEEEMQMNIDLGYVVVTTIGEMKTDVYETCTYVLHKDRYTYMLVKHSIHKNEKGMEEKIDSITLTKQDATLVFNLLNGAQLDLYDEEMNIKNPH